MADRSDIQEAAWKGVIETGNALSNLLKGDQRYSSRTPELSGSPNSQVATFVFEDGEGTDHLYQVRVTIDRPYGDGEGFCKVCRIRVEKEYANEILREMLDMSLCFMCLFWSKKAETKDTPDAHILVSPDFNFYTFNAPVPIGQTRRRTLGHGGHWFYAKRDDGKELASNDVWHSGKVPPVWREKIPSNGQFTSEPPEWFVRVRDQYGKVPTHE